MFQDKVIVITGGAGGIGKCIAEEFRKSGAQVCVIDCAEGDHYVGDIADQATLETFANTVIQKYGKVDVLVNNAGVVDDAYLLMINEDSLSRSLDINIKGYFHCAQQAALKMMKNRAGKIINMSSVSSILALEGQAVYSATKGAVNSMTAVLAKELARYGIQVNAVAPGFVETEMIEAIPEEKKQEYLKNLPAKRFCKTEEIANMVSLLASDKCSYMTGQVLVLDGGLSL